MADEPNRDNDTIDIEVKDSWMWIKDSKGFGSVTVTLMTVSFWLTSLAYVLGLFDGQIYGFHLRPFDVGAAAAYFGLCASLYGGRKWTDAKYNRGN